MIQHLCVITDRYPTKEYPMNTFLDQLICQFADMGIDCTVITPYSHIRDIIKGNDYRPPKHYIKKTENGSEISIYSPRIFIVTGKKIGPFNFAKLFQYLFDRAAKRVLKKLDTEFDAFYGHFITPAGFTAAGFGQLFHKPSFIAYGECFLDQDSCNFSIEEIRSRLADVNGVVAVSTKNRDELTEYEIIDPKKIGVFPNAINSNRFYKADKQQAREKLGFGQDDFIVAFTGHFDERKGSNRLAEALRHSEGVKSIFIGSGPCEPECDGILFKGRVPHEQVVWYLNAADVFVLPTRAEGCCNAIVEAMACGLPIISSDLPFNDDILTDENSVRVDPDNVEQIRDAIRKVRDDREGRIRMGEASLKIAAGLTIDNRARNILNFMNTFGEQ